MVGFGRTGKYWGFQNYEGVVPDIMTSAKGLSGSFLPLSVVGVKQEIKDHFMTSPLGWGATYQAHPVALACAYESVKHMLKGESRSRGVAGARGSGSQGGRESRGHGGTGSQGHRVTGSARQGVREAGI